CRAYRPHRRRSRRAIAASRTRALPWAEDTSCAPDLGLRCAGRLSGCGGASQDFARDALRAPSRAGARVLAELLATARNTAGPVVGAGRFPHPSGAHASATGSSSACIEAMRQSGDVHTLKQYLGRTEDKARLAYGHETGEFARQFVIIGTTNEAGGYLRDATGN